MIRRIFKLNPSALVTIESTVILRTYRFIARGLNLAIEGQRQYRTGIDLLPASKEKLIDTLLTLSGKNITNTESLNHQLAVLREVVGKPIEDLESLL